MNKRTFLKIIAQSLLVIGFSQTSVFSALKEIIKTDEEWEKILTPEQFIILRKEGTERPFTSPLNNEKREGEYVCVACNTKLFHSSMKYDSGTGWPSFFDFYKGNLKTKTDFKLYIQELNTTVQRAKVTMVMFLMMGQDQLSNDIVITVLL